MKKNPVKYIALFLVFFLIQIIISSAAFADNRPVLIVGDDEYYPPYSFIDEKGQPAGFNIELYYCCC
jgi:ABC-type amino acid transport substrate-binding protein